MGRRRSLKFRLLAALLGTALVVLIGFDLVVTEAMRSYLVSRTDAAVDIVQQVAVGVLNNSHPEPEETASLPSRTYYAAVVTADGTVHPLWHGRWAATQAPVLTGGLAAEAARHPVTATATSGDETFRVRIVDVPGRPGVRVIAAVSLSEMNLILDRMQLVLVIGIAGAFAFLTAVGWAILRRGLLPLERVAAQADRISGGDVSARVHVQRPTTEVGRLAGALNAMLARIADAARQRNASQARVRAFMADASHELRTPLTAVRAYAELYEQGALSAPEELDVALRRISSEAARMSDLVEQLLTLARSGEGPVEEVVEPVDLAALTRELVEDLRMLEPSRPWTLRATGGPVVVCGEPSRIRQILTNLLLNVRVHTPPCTAATVTVTTEEGHAVLQVADEGIGVPPEALPRLFDRFYRAHTADAQRGSGLGLAIVAAVTEAHGGHVEASHGHPAGLTITVHLPLAKSSPAA